MTKHFLSWHLMSSNDYHKLYLVQLIFIASATYQDQYFAQPQAAKSLTAGGSYRNHTMEENILFRVVIGDKTVLSHDRKLSETCKITILQNLDKISVISMITSFLTFRAGTWPRRELCFHSSNYLNEEKI